jgi:hypothetical protein
LGRTNEKCRNRFIVCRPDWASLCNLLLENVMKGLIAHYMELMGQVEFCPYCMEEKGDKTSCCQENHFVPFSDLDTDSQLEIIKEELV